MEDLPWKRFKTEDVCRVEGHYEAAQRLAGEERGRESKLGSQRRPLSKVHALATPEIFFLIPPHRKEEEKKPTFPPSALWRASLQIQAKLGNIVRPAFKPGVSTDSVTG